MTEPLTYHYSVTSSSLTSSKRADFHMPENQLSYSAIPLGKKIVIKNKIGRTKKHTLSGFYNIKLFFVIVGYFTHRC